MESKPLITVHEGVFEKLPGLVLISGLADLGASPTIDAPGITSYLQQGWDTLAYALQDENSEKSKRIARWTAGFKEVGISTKKFPPSIQAIAKRVAKGGEPFRINAIVDTYNAISMNLALPLGAFDAADMQGGLHLRLSPGGEAFVALGSSENDPTLPGELLYSDDNDVVTRMFLWRQSQRSKITEATRRFIFVCELLDDMGEAVVTHARETITEKLASLLGASISDVTIQTRRS